MVELYERIREFSDVQRLSKHEQIVQGVLASIEDQVVERGQMLPSINKLSNELGCARKTVDKAYGVLKDRGLVESKNRRGYFVSTESVQQSIRVALVLYEFRPFHETFYNVFRQSVGEHVQVDTFFHHNNLTVFEDIVVKIAGSYGLYVVAPVVDERSPAILSSLIQNRLLLIDRMVEMPGSIPRVVQEFEQSTYSILSSLRDRIGKYERVVLFHRAAAAGPMGIRRAVERFCAESKINCAVMDHYEPETVRERTLYLPIADSDLWSLLEDCIDRGWAPGREIGILSHNESKIKKIIQGGIATWSTDFGQMANRAARWVLERQPEQATIPTVFIDRNSF